MRKTALDMVYERACQDERIVFIGSDLGPGVLRQFREEMPDRFFMEGVNEAGIIGMAAGFASEGYEVWVNTIATFLTRRVFEQLAMDVCLHNHKVRLIGNGGGYVYAPLGPTHMAIDDIALMRALPNMNIVAPADAPEMRRVMLGLRDQPGPAYVRLGKGNEPDVTQEYMDAPYDRPVHHRHGKDVVLLTTGVTLHTALAAVEALTEDGIDVAVLHCPVIKALNTTALGAAFAGKRGVVVIEEHVPSGGLASAVAEWLVADENLAGMPFRRIGLPDAYPKHYGSQAELLAHDGVTPEAIVEAARDLMRRSGA